jgi:hypothetical protein
MFRSLLSAAEILSFAFECYIFLLLPPKRGKVAPWAGRGSDSKRNSTKLPEGRHAKVFSIEAILSAPPVSLSSQERKWCRGFCAKG